MPLRCLKMLILLAIASAADKPPRILEHPTDTLVRDDHSPVTLRCKASGYPKPRIEWFKDGRKMRKTGSRMPLPGGNLFFLFVSTKQNENGTWWCTARNNLGKARSRNATLGIMYLDEEFRQEPKSTKIGKGETLTLTCRPPRGLPRPMVTWTRNGDPVPMIGGRISQTHQGDLTIFEIGTADAGLYSCTAQNDKGTRTSSPALVKVYAKILPRIEGPPPPPPPPPDPKKKEKDDKVKSFETLMSGDSDFPVALKRPWIIVLSTFAIMLLTSTIVMSYLVRRRASRGEKVKAILEHPHNHPHDPGQSQVLLKGDPSYTLARNALWIDYSWVKGREGVPVNGRTTGTERVGKLFRENTASTSSTNGYSSAGAAGVDNRAGGSGEYEEVTDAHSMITFGKRKDGLGGGAPSIHDAEPYATTTLLFQPAGESYFGSSIKQSKGGSLKYV